MIQKRGQLTLRIKNKSKELLNYEITEKELRLMAYIQYVMVNEQHVDIAKITSEERTILSKWRELEYITGGASQMEITKEFWNIICEMLFLGYVDIN